VSPFLQSPFAIGFCCVALAAWVLMLCAIFWPRKLDRDGKDDTDDPRILF
jgi:hypothetical protein